MFMVYVTFEFAQNLIENPIGLDTMRTHLGVLDSFSGVSADTADRHGTMSAKHLLRCGRRGTKTAPFPCMWRATIIKRQ